MGRPHQFLSSECDSLFADDEPISDPQSAKQLPPSCNIAICLYIAGTKHDPVMT